MSFRRHHRGLGRHGRHGRHGKRFGRRYAFGRGGIRL